MPWRYRATEWGEQLNRHSSGVYDRLMRPHGKVIERCAGRSAATRRTSLSDCLSPLLQISQTVNGFDFPRQALPPHFHALGRCASRCRWRPGWSGRWTRTAFRLRSLGTLQGHRYGCCNIAGPVGGSMCSC